MENEMVARFSGRQIGIQISPTSDLYVSLAYVDDGYITGRNPMEFGATLQPMRHLGAIVELKYP